MNLLEQFSHLDAQQLSIRTPKMSGECIVLARACVGCVGRRGHRNTLCGASGFHLGPRLGPKASRSKIQTSGTRAFQGPLLEHCALFPRENFLPPPATRASHCPLPPRPRPATRTRTSSLTSPTRIATRQRACTQSTAGQTHAYSTMDEEGAPLLYTPAGAGGALRTRKRARFVALATRQPGER